MNVPVLPKNPDEWEGVTFTVHLDRPRTLRITLPALRTFEQKIGRAIVDGGLSSPEQLAVLIEVLSRAAGDPIDAREAVALLDSRSVLEIHGGFRLFTSEVSRMRDLAQAWGPAMRLIDAPASTDN
ncbi:hypothetical protein [Opitutus sp. ER46]|uniref:hypothetical protein n=1 Tax=Opitutus sp. ER46 TaxID=2161864 RepID=UPI000D2FF442|nr:hypothetical protein [Opitutus sp. ER46]PTX96572.1 hypothetical protein DB354_07905 [Opitutus sp. ER46]